MANQGKLSVNPPSDMCYKLPCKLLQGKNHNLVSLIRICYAYTKQETIARNEETNFVDVTNGGFLITVSMAIVQTD